MKNLMNKLAIIAILAALGIVGHMVVNHVGSIDNVKIQGKLKNVKDTINDTTNKKTGEDCNHDGQCASKTCTDSVCA